MGRSRPDGETTLSPLSLSLLPDLRADALPPSSSDDRCTHEDGGCRGKDKRLRKEEEEEEDA
jgi:hypothetical protein